MNFIHEATILSEVNADNKLLDEIISVVPATDCILITVHKSPEESIQKIAP